MFVMFVMFVLAVSGEAIAGEPSLLANPRLLFFCVFCLSLIS